MKTLQNHLILYDAECPMCNLYTSAFVKAGMLEEGGRAAYQRLPDWACPQVDRQRAVNEIALVNQRTGEVTYGVESLFTIIGTAIPLFNPLFSWKPFIWVMRKLYAFVSYNRRVIIPASEKAVNYEIQPAFRKEYRIAYLLVTWLITAFILSSYARLLTGVVPGSGLYREFLICGGQIAFQGLIVNTYARQQSWNYLGNMMTISLGGALLLALGMALGAVMHATPLVYTGYFLLVAGAMLLEHMRRSKLLKLGYTLTISWVLYRVVLLFLILQFA